jgi:hypothetical protein
VDRTGGAAGRSLRPTGVLPSPKAGCRSVSQLDSSTSRVVKFCNRVFEGSQGYATWNSALSRGSEPVITNRCRGRGKARRQSYVPRSWRRSSVTEGSKPYRA